MHVNASKISKKTGCHPIISVTIWILCLVVPAGTSMAEDVKGSWDQWLDNAYQLTWHDQPNITKWIAENEVKVFDKKLTDFVSEWEMRMKAIPEDGKLHVFPDKAFRQLAIAQMLLYLSTSDIEYLKKALTTMNAESLKAKGELPEIAYWYYYIRAHYDMETGKSDKFVRDVYLIWLNVILKLESAKYEIGHTASITNLHGFYSSIPYLYRNVANLVLQRAIVKRKLTGIDALGVIVWSLSPRMPSKGYGKWVEEVVRRIKGPESDNFRLSFTVQLMEAEKKRLEVQNLFDAGDDPVKIEKSLIECLTHYEMLYGLARTLHGKATAETKRLQLISFVLSRLYEEGPHQAVWAEIPMFKRHKGNAWHEDKAAIDQAIRIYDDLIESGIRSDSLIRDGFLSEKTYTSAMHDLWRAIMNLCLDTGLYYEQLIDPKDAKNLQTNIPLIEKALVRYLDLFARYVNKGYQSTVPDNAFYGAVEAAELLSEMYFLSAPWEKGMKKYDLALARRIQAMEIFPFDVNNYYLTSQRLSELGRLEKYKEYVFMLAQRIRHSQLIKDSTVQKQRYLGNDLKKMQQVIPEIILRAPYNIVLQKGFAQVPEELSKRLSLIEKETGKTAKANLPDAAARNKIVEITHQLQQRLSGQKTFKNEDILTLLKETEPLTTLIEKELKPVAAKTDIDDQQPFGPDLFPSDLKQLALEIKEIREECEILNKLPDTTKLRDTLVFEVNHPFHTLLRRFYHENAHQDLNYLRLLRGESPKEPSNLPPDNQQRLNSNIKPQKGLDFKE